MFNKYLCCLPFQIKSSRVKCKLYSRVCELLKPPFAGGHGPEKHDLHPDKAGLHLAGIDVGHMWCGCTTAADRTLICVVQLILLAIKLDSGSSDF